MSTPEDNRSIEARLTLLENAGIANLLQSQRQEQGDSHVWTAEQVKSYVEALLQEKDRALEMADNEREKAASALRGEQQRAIDRAESERERSAANLRIEVERARREGDERLNEHIENQVQQIREALVSAELLERERVAKVAAEVESTGRELALLHAASERAIAKAEVSNEKRFEAQNEFRNEARVVREEQQKQTAILASTFMPREVADAKFLEHGKLIDALMKQQNLDLGRRAGIGVSGGVLASGIAALAAFIGIVVVVANILTTQ